MLTGKPKSYRYGNPVGKNISLILYRLSSNRRSKIVIDTQFEKGFASNKMLVKI